MLPPVTVGPAAGVTGYLLTNKEPTRGALLGLASQALRARVTWGQGPGLSIWEKARVPLDPPTPTWSQVEGTALCLSPGLARAGTKLPSTLRTLTHHPLHF